VALHARRPDPAGKRHPYGTPAAAAIVAIRCALQAGLTDAQTQAVTGGQLQRLLAGDDPADLGPAPGSAPPRPPLLDRVSTLLVTALARMLDGEPATGLLQLARLGCQADSPTPQAPLLEQITELLDRHQHYARTTRLDGRRAAGFHLVLAAAALAATPDVP
jgi:uncharacterized protein